MVYETIFDRSKGAKYRLMGMKCKKCGRVYYPFQYICEDCYGHEFEEVSLPRMGTIHSLNLIPVPPAMMMDKVEYTGPYYTVMVDLDTNDEVKNTVRLICQMTDLPYPVDLTKAWLPAGKDENGNELPARWADDVKIGTRVELVFRKQFVVFDGGVKYGINARLLPDKEGGE